MLAVILITLFATYIQRNVEGQSLCMEQSYLWVQ